ncbi:Diacylglycerol kinase epsilon [Amphibalanus amphitrite]|uniref:Diacylglycerol kinase epsilon n=1 Tax=Amphibalanus amphitrite TaxID=1232801 RepID=A0A6A4W6D8_AMPAM|nr:Diacylglycerol kinase epsilon [Amphibalanus amphitrite]
MRVLSSNMDKTAPDPTVAAITGQMELSVRDAAASVLVALLFGFLVRRWVKRTPRVMARDTRRGHRWSHTGMFSQPSYCNICESLLMTSRGAFCDACGVCACPTCVRPANKQLTCKAVTSREASHKHHWVQGNLPFDSTCEVCDSSVGDSPELTGQRCCWCHRTIHDQCRKNISEVCDLGEFSQYIVPPTCVKVRATTTVPRRLTVAQVSRPATSTGAGADKPWTPLIVLGNRKSGSTDAEQVLSAFRRYLNPAQVVDLGDQRPEDGLEWCHLVGPERCRVLVAGGDGTVDWVLNAIENLKLQPPPAVGILPLGTGNDLSRVLGSGEAYVEVDPEQVLRRLQRAEVINVDRWLVRGWSLNRP